MKILLLTVGGSDQPIVRSIKTNNPDFVYFFATETKGPLNAGSIITVDGEGLVYVDQRTGEKRVSIVAQTGLPSEKYLKIIVESDNPYSTYILAYKIIKERLNQNDKVIVDYTGGTKSMTVGLAIAGMEFPEVEISIVTGIRKDLVRVNDGMEKISKLPSNRVFIQRQLKITENLISEGNYYVANRTLQDLSTHQYMEQDGRFNRLYYLSAAFDKWDKFHYEEAAKIIQLYKNDEMIKPFNETVQKLANSVKWYKNWKPESKNPPGPGFLLVYDLLLNAERKAALGQYDDAVSRIYRALEMYEQFCLMTGTPKLNSADIDVTLLPKELAHYYERKRNPRNQKVQIALEEGYQLLEKLNHPVGSIWKNYEGKLRNVLQIRNFSFFAHGVNSISESDYLEMKDVVWSFIMECDRALAFKRGLKDYQQLHTNFQSNEETVILPD